MSTTQRYSTGLDKSTHEGGYQWMLRHLDGTTHTYLDLINHQIELNDLPRSERSLFWHGQMDALHDTMARFETAALTGGGEEGPPATITPECSFDLMDSAVTAYYLRNERQVDYATLTAVKDAMRDGSAVVTLYSDKAGERTARVLWPNALSITKDNNLVARCYCTLRREIKCFRLDRMLTCHALTTPDDMEPAPAAKA